MKINVQTMSDVALEKCRADVAELTRKIYAHPQDASWLKAFVGGEPFEEKRFEIEDFELKMPEEGADVQTVRLENSIILHNALKDLPGYIIGDVHFWAWLTFTKGYRYASAKSEMTADYIKNWWVPRGDNTRRSVMLHVLGRDYCAAEMTFNPTEENPYAATEYLSSNQELYRNLVFRNISDIPAVAHGIVGAVRDYEKETGDHVSSDRIREILKFVSNLGSVRLIDTIPEKEIYERVKAEVYRLEKNKVE